jgi:predicted RNA-binding protein with PUA-like domain
MAYWLAKTEPDVYSIDDLARDAATKWTGVRNYQARNYLRAMEVGDAVIVYHSNAKPPGAAGLATVKRCASADPTQFDKDSEYYDPKASVAAPRWFSPTLEFAGKFEKLVSLDQMRGVPELDELQLLQRGTRLSVIPLEKTHFLKIVQLAGYRTRKERNR